MGFDRYLIFAVFFLLLVPFTYSTNFFQMYDPNVNNLTCADCFGDEDVNLTKVVFPTLERNYKLQLWTNDTTVPKGTYTCPDWPALCTPPEGDLNELWYNIPFECLTNYGCCGDFPEDDKAVIAFQNYAWYMCSKLDENRDTNPTSTLWYWIDAAEQPFRVYRMNMTKYGGPVYDVVSNSYQWFVCDGTTTGILAPAYDVETTVRGPDDTPLDIPFASTTASTGIDVGGNLPVTPTGTGIGDNTQNGIQPINTFCEDCTVTGPAVAAGQDLDGDGYPAPDPNNPDPSSDDCDDTDQKTFPGAPDPCSTAKDEDCDGGTGSSGSNCQNLATDETLADLLNPQELASRFICYNEDEVGIWSECAGYHLGTAQNQPRARRQGNILTTLFEFSGGCPGDTNCVFFMKLLQNTGQEYAAPFMVGSGEARIKEWSEYRALSFFAYFSNNYVMDIALYKGSGTSMANYQLIKKLPVIDYAVNGASLGKWLKIEIPLNLLNEKHVDLIRFEASRQEVEDAGGTTTSGGTTYNNIVGIDKIHLVPYTGLKYCSSELYNEPYYNNSWISDLDSPIVGRYGTQVGQLACNDIPGYGWTGTQCCGEEIEYYNDTEHGCWAGNRVLNGQRVMSVRFITGIDGVRNEVCTKNECDFALKGDPTDYLTLNPNPALYDLAFYEKSSLGADVPIDGKQATEPTASLKAKDVPLQLLYYNKTFWGCNAASYIKELGVDAQGNSIIQNLLPDQYCTVKGKYFCSFEREWSNASAGGALSYERSEKKVGYPGVNLLYNSDFEDVDIQAGILSPIECKTVDGSCETGWTGVLSMVKETNTHAATYRTDDPNYAYSLCCKMKDETPLTTASGTTVFSLVSETNSHVSIEPADIPIMLGAEGKNIVCNYGQCNFIHETCLGSVVDDTNSHYLQCNQGTKNICCTIPEDDQE